MFIRLLISSIFFIVLVHSEVTNSSKGQISAVTTNPILPKSGSQYDDYDFNDKKSNGEGSGSSANLDDYADEEDDQLSKITASTTVSTSTTTITRTTTTKKITSSTKKTDLDVDEFSEDYKDDVADDVDYNEVSTKITTTSTPVLSTTRSSSSTGQRRSPIRVFFSFLTRPPIAAGILAGSLIIFIKIFFE